MLTAPWDSYRRTIAAILTAVTLVVIGSGCSGSDQSTEPSTPTHSANGQVKYEDGSAVTAGLIEFTPIDAGLPARATIGSDGSFSLSTIQDNGSISVGAKAGKYRVTVIPPPSENRSEPAIPASQELTVSAGQNEFPVTIPKPQK